MTMKHDAKNTPLYEVLHDLLLKIFVKLGECEAGAESSAHVYALRLAEAIDDRAEMIADDEVIESAWSIITHGRGDKVCQKNA